MRRVDERGAPKNTKKTVEGNIRQRGTDWFVWVTDCINGKRARLRQGGKSEERGLIRGSVLWHPY